MNTILETTMCDVKRLAKSLDSDATDEELDELSNGLCSGRFDLKKTLDSYVLEPLSPNGKDQMRIYDIIKKAQKPGHRLSIANADYTKMLSLALRMNNLIKGEEKRVARHNACLHYGLVELASCFS